MRCQRGGPALACVCRAAIEQAWSKQPYFPRAKELLEGEPDLDNRLPWPRILVSSPERQRATPVVWPELYLAEVHEARVLEVDGVDFRWRARSMLTYSHSKGRISTLPEKRLKTTHDFLKTSNI